MSGIFLKIAKVGCAVLSHWFLTFTKTKIRMYAAFRINTHISPYPPNPPQSHLFLSLLSAQNVEESTQALLQELDTVMCGLEWHIRQWKTHQLHTCVSRKPEGSQEKEPTYVENM